MTREAIAPTARTDIAPIGPSIRIAIVVVCRNVLPELHSTIQSVMALNDPRVLPIVIDGASTDGTVDLLTSLRGWAHHTCSEPDRGIYDAMNKGWQQAPADSYILYLGAGDLVHTLPRDDELRDMQGRPWPLILGNARVGDRPFRSRWNAELRLRNTAHHQAMLVMKTLSPTPPFDAGLRFYADWDFNLRLYRRGIVAHHVPTLCTYAAPGGASWSMELVEIRRVARRHSGWLFGAASWTLNGASRWRRMRRDAAAARVPSPSS